MPSSVIRRFGYHPGDASLEITFVSGKRYRYLDVPPDLYQRMRESFSKGEFFNRHIRDHFDFEKADGIS
jgi:lysyl-tRNA synthetase class 2